jgi:hypothetical protein
MRYSAMPLRAAASVRDIVAQSMPSTLSVTG